MKRLLMVISVAILAVGPFALSAGAQAPIQGTVSAELQAFVRTSYIFEFADSVSAGQARGRAAVLVRGANGTLDHVYTFGGTGFSARMGSVAADNLFRTNDDIVGYSRDGIVSIAQSSRAPGGVPGKPDKGGDSSESLAPQEIPFGITRVNGGFAPASGKTACIIDTGIDLDHPDLNVDKLNSISFVLTGKDYDSADDQNGHGTHVAGTIAAIDNKRDVIGVAAGATVVSVRVLDRRGSGTWSGVRAGIGYVATKRVGGRLLCDVANLSLGGGKNDSVDAKVVEAAVAGVMFAIAAGNSGADANNYSPARVEHDGVYTVSAVDSGDVFAYFSNWGNPPIEYAAPGVSVLSLWKNGGMKTISGTSMAAPHVAGLLLLGSIATDNRTAIGDTHDYRDPIPFYSPGP